MLNWFRLRAHFLSLGAFLLIAAGGVRALWVAHTRNVQRAATAVALARIPARVLWVWERPEDLRRLNPSSSGVAILEQTIYLGHSITVVSRRQPVILPAGISRTAVVRIQAARSFRGNAIIAQAAAALLVRTANRAALDDFEIDFDATSSQRAFYRDLLTRVRAQMPPHLPLSITALASWCSNDDWLAGLPIDEAIPMFFRMEPDRLRMTAVDKEKYAVTEPLCKSSIGLSTREAWPADLAGKRLYIFADEGWQQDLPLLEAAHPQLRPASLETKQ